MLIIYWTLCSIDLCADQHIIGRYSGDGSVARGGLDLSVGQSGVGRHGFIGLLLP